MMHIIGAIEADDDLSSEMTGLGVTIQRALVPLSIRRARLVLGAGSGWSEEERRATNGIDESPFTRIADSMNVGAGERAGDCVVVVAPNP